MSPISMIRFKQCIKKTKMKIPITTKSSWKQLLLWLLSWSTLGMPCLWGSSILKNMAKTLWNDPSLIECLPTAVGSTSTSVSLTVSLNNIGHWLVGSYCFSILKIFDKDEFLLFQDLLECFQPGLYISIATYPWFRFRWPTLKVSCTNASWFSIGENVLRLMMISGEPSWAWWTYLWECWLVHQD